MNIHETYEDGTVKRPLVELTETNSLSASLAESSDWCSVCVFLCCLLLFLSFNWCFLSCLIGAVSASLSHCHLIGAFSSFLSVVWLVLTLPLSLSHSHLIGALSASLCLSLSSDWWWLPGMGPMPWTVNSEIYPLWARSTGNACSAGANWTFNVLVSLTFLHMAQFLTYYGKHTVMHNAHCSPLGLSLDSH